MQSSFLYFDAFAETGKEVEGVKIVGKVLLLAAMAAGLAMVVVFSVENFRIYHAVIQQTEISGRQAEQAGYNHTEEETGSPLTEAGIQQNQDADQEKTQDMNQENSQDKQQVIKQEKPQPQTDEVTYHQVSQSYFSDAVFIGDSRTTGLQESGLLPDASYYAEVGIGIDALLRQRFIYEAGMMLTLEEALSRHSFGKVYLMIGINDMSSGDEYWFVEKYKELLRIVQSTQPDALIYIQQNIPMSYAMQDMSGSLNNERLRLRNEASGQLADNNKIFYLAAGEVYEDANGNLISYYTSDGLHIKPEYYPLWVEYLQCHAVL